MVSKFLLLEEYRGSGGTLDGICLADSYPGKTLSLLPTRRRSYAG